MGRLLRSGMGKTIPIQVFELYYSEATNEQNPKVTDFLDGLQDIHRLELKLEIADGIVILMTGPYTLRLRYFCRVHKRCVVKILTSMPTHEGCVKMEDTVGQGPRDNRTSHHSGPNYRSSMTASILMTSEAFGDSRSRCPIAPRDA